MPTVEAIRKELTTEFASAFSGNEKRLEDCVAVAHFLAGHDDAVSALTQIDARMATACGQHGDDVKQYLDALEKHALARTPAKLKALEKKAGYGSHSAQATLKTLHEGVAPTHPPVRHLLTSVLADIETLGGFGKVKVDIPLGFIEDSDAFRRVITLGRMFKDPSVPGNHGEHTHRLQWSMITLAKVVPAPADLYKFVGSVVYEKDPKRGLWDAMCDRDGGEAAGVVPFRQDYQLKNRDFRAPELLIGFICDRLNETKFPLLQLYTKVRLAKRRMGFEAKDYVTKKKFPGLTYQQLQADDRETVDTILASGWLT